MRNNYFLKRMLGYSLLLFCAVAGNAQTPLQLQSGSLNGSSRPLPPASVPTLDNFCRGTVLSKNLRETLGTEDAYNAIYQQGLISAQNESGANRVVRVLPTVVHVIYGNTTENISDAKVNAFIAAINAAFSQTNNQSGVRTQFQSVIGNPQVQFCLATTDPSGNPTTGIIRKSTSLANFDIDDNSGDAPIKKLPNGSPTWNPQKYVNIWIVDIGWQSGASGGTAGYAYLPNSFSIAPGSPTAYLDGLVVDVNATFGTPQGDYSIGIHELGHYLGLPHTFPDGASSCVEANGDGFTDTPPTNSATQTSQACSATITKCGNTVQTENFMDYQIHCHQMFTLQQANYMNNNILNPTTGFRKLLLWNGCAASAGVAPVANFTGCNSSVAQNSTVTFTDASTGVPTSWAWTITPATGWSYVGGTSATSQNPQVQFTALGNYNVALTATNAQGNNTKTSTACITVVAAGACNNLSSPLIMGFEASENITGWTVENTNGDVAGTDPVTWGLYDNAQGTVAHGGTRLIGYRYNEDETTAANDWFFTPCLALQSGTTYNLSFWHKVHASGGVTYAEKLRVRIGNTNISTAMTQNIVDLGSLTNTAWVQSTNTFTVPTSGNYNIGFQSYSDANKFLLAIDDINISKVTSTVITPVANFTGCGNYNVGSTVTFTNTSTNSPTSNSWTITPATGWSYTGGTNANSVSPQVTFNTAGSYTVALTATNSAGSHTKTSSACAVVTSTVVAPVANFTGCGNYATGATVTFTNTSTNSPTSNSWTITPATGWSYTGGTNANSVSPQVTFTTAGSYTIALTATNSAGSHTKTSPACAVVTQPSSAPTASFTGCGNYSTNATVSLVNTSSGATSYSWSISPSSGWVFTGGTGATSANPQVIFNVAGSYTITLTATNSIGSDTEVSSNCVSVSSITQPAGASYQGCPNEAVSPGTTITFANMSTGSPTSYLWEILPNIGWSFEPGSSNTSTNPQVTFTGIGYYSVSLTASNSAGTSTAGNPMCVVVSANAGINENDAYGNVVLFPNPSTGLTTLSLGNVASYNNLSVSVYNAVGVKLHQTSGQVPSELTLDFSAYSAGIYFVEIRSNEGVSTKRFVLNK